MNPIVGAGEEVRLFAVVVGRAHGWSSISTDPGIAMPLLFAFLMLHFARSKLSNT